MRHPSNLFGAAVLALVCATPAAAQSDRHGLPKPIQIRVQGYFVEKPADTIPDATWLVALRGKQYPFYVRQLQVLQGDVSPMNIYEIYEPYRPTFFLHSDDTTLDRIEHAPVGHPITFVAYLRFASRHVVVGGVE